MAGRLTEEQITKILLKWLISQNWEIICFDFPQSGTGYVLHPNEDIRTSKNKGAIIPDIVAIKDSTCLFFENKDRFVMSDFEKISLLRSESDYFFSIEKLLSKWQIEHIFYGVGLPKLQFIENKTLKYLDLIDFALFIEYDSKSVSIGYQIKEIFS